MTARITTIMTIKMTPMTPPITGPGSDGEIGFFDSSEEESFLKNLYQHL